MPLFLFYAAITLVPIVVLGVVLARSFRADLEHRALEEGSTIASVIASSAVEHVLTGDELADGPTPAERVALANEFAPILRRGDALVLRLRDTEGHVVFDPSQPQRAPFGPSDDEVSEAIAGEPVRLLTRLNADTVDDGHRLGARAIEVYTPVRAVHGDRRPLGALEVYVPYAPIRASIEASARHMTGLLVVGLLALWAVLAAMTWSVTRRVRRSAALAEHLARTDSLTGLANRAAMTEHLGEVLARGDSPATTVLVVDIDGFGAINQTLGQENGDAFLRHMADVVVGVVGDESAVARTGGDQFGVVLAGTTSAGSGAVIDAIRKALLREHLLGGVALTVEVTVGRVEDGGTTEAAELIRRANVACRAAKTAKVQLLDYEEELEGFDADRLRLMTELRHGIAEDQLVLHFQPKIRIDHGALTGVEALVRWQHPTRGLLMPGAFVPAAESTELIVELTDWVLDAACAQGAAWQHAGRPLPIAVNVSARCLRDAAFSDRVLAALVRHGLESRLLTVEITETAVISDPERAAATLRRLSQRGVHVSLDDFGVGYTSLGHLDRLPIDELKIDRQFVASLASGGDGGAVVRAVVSLGHGLGMNVVAEGVEERSTIALLASLGCDVAQGYVIARPAPLETFEAWWRERTGEMATEGADVSSSA